MGVSETGSTDAMRVIFSNCSPLKLTKLPNYSWVLRKFANCHSYERSVSYRVVVGVSETGSICTVQYKPRISSKVQGMVTKHTQSRS